jgi:threonine/homoserine/homoserine lactone efflux protein
MQSQDKSSKAGPRASLWIAGLGLFWLCINLAGGYLGWSNRTRALFDLLVLAGFGLALWNVIKLWRARQSDRG